jgi:hypothetical protein
LTIKPSEVLQNIIAYETNAIDKKTNKIIEDCNVALKNNVSRTPNYIFKKDVDNISIAAVVDHFKKLGFNVKSSYMAGDRYDAACYTIHFNFT